MAFFAEMEWHTESSDFWLATPLAWRQSMSRSLLRGVLTMASISRKVCFSRLPQASDLPVLARSWVASSNASPEARPSSKELISDALDSRQRKTSNSSLKEAEAHTKTEVPGETCQATSHFQPIPSGFQRLPKKGRWSSNPPSPYCSMIGGGACYSKASHSILQIDLPVDRLAGAKLAKMEVLLLGGSNLFIPDFGAVDLLSISQILTSP